MTGVIVDTSISTSEQCVLLWPDDVTGYDDQNLANMGGVTAIIIPAGRHEVRYESWGRVSVLGGTQYVPYTENGSVTYDFEAGKIYYLYENSPEVSAKSVVGRNGYALVTSHGSSSIDNWGKAFVYNDRAYIKEDEWWGVRMGKNGYIGIEGGGNISLGWTYPGGPRVGSNEPNGSGDNQRQA
jgi:hypothetical protein